MSVKGKTSPSTAPLMKNAAGAPVVYFDNVPVFGHWSGNFEIELAARMLLPKPDGGVMADMACAAHLRCSPAAAVLLIDALTKCLDMLSKSQEEHGNILTN